MLEFDTATETLRARLAHERLLTQQRNELATANSRIAQKAKVLSAEVIEKREAAEAALIEANQFKTRTHEALRNLRKARGDVVMAERRLWASIETIEDGFAVFDRDRKVIAANRAFLLPFADMDCVDMGISHAELIDIAAEEGVIDPGDRSPADWARWMKSRWDADEIDPVVIRLWDNSFVRLVERRTDDGDMVVLGSNITPTSIVRIRPLQTGVNEGTERKSRSPGCFFRAPIASSGPPASFPFRPWFFTYPDVA